MEDRKTNSPEEDNLLPLDFEEAAKVMSGEASSSQPAAAAAPVPDAVSAAGEPVPAFLEEVVAEEEIIFQETPPAAPAPVQNFAPAPEVQKPVMPPPTSSSGFGDTSRKPSRTLADELSKSKSPLEISFGSSLRGIREAKGIDLNDVADRTKIRKDYLEAIEAEDFSRLPSAVFVCGYVRKICDLYGAPAEITDDIIQQLKGHSEYGLGEDNIEQIIDSDNETNRDVDRKIRHTLLFVITAVAVVVIGGIGTIVFLSMSKRERGPVPPPVLGTFDAKSLEELNPPHVIKMSELPIPEN